MLIAEHTMISSAPPANIWKLWADVASWNEWDQDIEYARLEGEFQAGAKGVLKPRSGPRVAFTIAELAQGVSFTSISSLPLTRLRFAHHLVPMPGGGCKVTHRIEMSGMLAFLFGRLLGPGMKSSLPQAMDRLNQSAQAL